MAEDYQRAQADAAALQEALAARRASVIPAPVKVPVSNSHKAMTYSRVGPPKAQVSMQGQAPRAQLILPRAHYQPVRTVQQSLPVQRAVRQYARRTSPSTLPDQPMETLRRQSIIPAAVHQSRAISLPNIDGGPPALDMTHTTANASSSNTAPIPAPYRQPTMQDLPLIKPPPRAPESGSFDIQTQRHKEDSQYTLSRGALRDERYRERLAAERATATRLQELARSTETGGQQSPRIRDMSGAPAMRVDSRAYPSLVRDMPNPAAAPKPQGGLMISLDSPLLSPRTRARIIAATTGMTIPPAPRARDTTTESSRQQSQRATPPAAHMSIPRLPPNAQVDIDEYTRFRAQQHGKRPSHPVSPKPQNRLPSLTRSPDQMSRRRISLSDDLARLQHRPPPLHPAAKEADLRAASIGPMRAGSRGFTPPSQGVRLAPYAPRLARDAPPPHVRSGEEAAANHMTNAAIIATAAAAAMRTHGPRSPAAASFPRPRPVQSRPTSRKDGLDDISPLKDQPGYAEWRREQDAALAAAKEAYEAEIENERQAQKVEERKRERLRQLERIKQLECNERSDGAEYDDASRAVERYRTERWQEGLLREIPHDEKALRSHPLPRERQTSRFEQCTTQAVYKPRSTEEEKRRRRKIQYQVFVHARATQCKWHNCHAILTSWSNLEKHIQQAHIKPLQAAREEQVDRKPDITQLDSEVTPNKASVIHHCDWTDCTKRYDDLERLYRHCLVEHMGDFCARCPFQCRYEGPDFGSLMAHIERRHPHCTPADFTPAVSRPSPPRHLAEPPTLPRFAWLGANDEMDAASATDGVTPTVRPASPTPDSRVGRFVQRGSVSRLPAEAYDIDNSRDKGWVDRRVAGKVVEEIVKLARVQAVTADSAKAQDANKREGSADSVNPLIVVEDEDIKSEASAAAFHSDTIKSLAKDIRKRVRSEMGGTPPTFQRAVSPWNSPRIGAGYLSPGTTPRPSKRALLDVSDTEGPPASKRASDDSARYLSPEDEKVPARGPRINLRLSSKINGERSNTEPTVTSPSRHLTLPASDRAPTASPTPSESRLSAPRTPRRRSEVESFKALFANVKVAPQVMDATPSPEPMPMLLPADVRDRAVSHPSPAVPRRGLLELPAPAAPRPRSVSDQPIEQDRTDARHRMTENDSPLLAHAAKLLSGVQGSSTARPAAGSLWRSLQSDAREAASVERSTTPESHAVQKLGLRERDRKVSYAESECTLVESEYEEEEGMNVDRLKD